MSLRIIKTFLLLFFLLLIPFYSCMVEGFNDGTNINAKPIYSLLQSVKKVGMRKLAMLDAVLDYDDPGPNPRHDPRRRSGGGHP